VSGFLEEWGLNSEPFTFMLDKDGIIVAKFEGFVTLSELEAKITEILEI
jgi:glutathione peroxidase-family protein